MLVSCFSVSAAVWSSGPLKITLKIYMATESEPAAATEVKKSGTELFVQTKRLTEAIALINQIEPKKCSLLLSRLLGQLHQKVRPGSMKSWL